VAHTAVQNVEGTNRCNRKEQYFVLGENIYWFFALCSVLLCVLTVSRITAVDTKCREGNDQVYSVAPQRYYRH